MAKIIELYFNPLNPVFQDIDGNDVAEIEVETGQQISFKVIDTIGFAAINQFDSDFIITSNESTKYKLPSYSTLENVEMQSDPGVEFFDSDALIYTMASGLVSQVGPQVLGQREVPNSTPNNHPRVRVLVNNIEVFEGTEWSLVDNTIDAATGSLSTFIEFANGSQPKENDVIRVKWQQYDNSPLNGVNAIEVQKVPDWWSFWITSSDHSAKTRIWIKESKTHTKAIGATDRAPLYVKQNWPVFMKFMETYFENFETVDIIKELMDLRDIDKTSDFVLDKIGFSKLNLIPKSALVDKKLLIKNILAFYDQRGTERTYSFLMQILFKKKATIREPKFRVFRGSSSDFEQQKTLRIVSMSQAFGLVTQPVIDKALEFFGVQIYSQANQFGDDSLLQFLKSTKITGVQSGASAVVEDFRQFVISGTTVTELILSNIVGEFIPNEVISPVAGVKLSDIPDKNQRSLHFVHAMTMSQISGLKFNADLGSGLTASVADQFSFISASGQGAVANKGILNPVILNPGFNYEAGDIATLQTLDASNNVVSVSTWTVETTAVVTGKGRWTSNESFASDFSVSLHDSWYYQLYSYVIVANVQQADYKQTFDMALHTAGTQMFSEFRAGTDLKISDSVEHYTFEVDGSNSFLFVSNNIIDTMIIFSGDRILDASEFNIILSNGKTFVELNEAVENTGLHLITIKVPGSTNAATSAFKNELTIKNELANVNRTYNIGHSRNSDLSLLGASFLDSLLNPTQLQQTRDESQASWVNINSAEADVLLKPLFISGVYVPGHSDFTSTYRNRYNTTNSYLPYQAFFNEIENETLLLKQYLNYIISRESNRLQRRNINWSSQAFRVCAFDKNTGAAVLNNNNYELHELGSKIGSIIKTVEGQNVLWALVSFINKTSALAYDGTETIVYKMYADTDVFF